MSVAYLKDLLLEQNELRKQTWYNQPSCDRNRISIDKEMERLTIEECGRAYQDAALIIFAEFLRDRVRK